MDNRDTESNSINSRFISLAGLLIIFLLVLPSAFFLVNLKPYLMIFSVIISLAITLIFFTYKPVITIYHKNLLVLLAIIYIYLAISYFFTNQGLGNFLSYSFIRNDGNFFFCYLPFFMFAVPFFNYKKATRIFYFIIFVVFTSFALMGIFEYLTKFSDFTLQHNSGAGYMFVAFNFAHNATGSIYAVVSIFALIFFLEEKLKKYKFLYLLAFIICVAGLFITKSRGSYVGFVAGFIFVLWMHFKSIKKFLISILVFLAAFLPFIFITDTHKRIFQIFTSFKGGSDAYTTITRMDLWEKAWFLFEKSPLFGVGFGRYNDIEKNLYYRLEGISGVVSTYNDQNFIFNTSHAHNSYLHFLAETGIVGLFLILLFWFICYKIIYKAYCNSEDKYLKKFYLSGLASIIVLFFLAFTENYFSATTIMICISMQLSLTIGIFSMENRFKKINKFGNFG